MLLVSGMVPRPGETASESWSKSGYSELPSHEGDEISLFLLDSWPDVETRYLALSDDRTFPAPCAREMARDRLGIDADEMPGSH